MGARLEEEGVLDPEEPEEAEEPSSEEMEEEEDSRDRLREEIAEVRREAGFSRVMEEEEEPEPRNCFTAGLSRSFKMFMKK